MLTEPSAEDSSVGLSHFSVIQIPTTEGLSIRATELKTGKLEASTTVAATVVQPRIDLIVTIQRRHSLARP